jgi:capsule biosynthesis phosphatase
MIYVLTAAGEGRRFLEAGYQTPKPLLRIDGKEALLWSIDSLPLRKGDTLVLVVQAAQKVQLVLGDVVKRALPHVAVHWVELIGITAGQLESALKAKAFVADVRTPVAIYNCDTYFECGEIGLRLEERFDGVIPCAQGVPGTSWSFAARDDATGLASAVAEKRAISSWASVGYYGFKSWSLFETLALEALVDARTTGVEAYVAPVYNRLLQRGGRVYVPAVEGFYPFGTPEQVASYWPGARLEESLAVTGKKPVIVIDFDNTLTVDGPEIYGEKLPRQDVIDRLREYRSMGYEIVIHTARNMKTQNNNIGKVIANVGAVSIEWLKKHDVPFDSLVFGKPFAEEGFYVDDKAVRPSEFLSLSREELRQLVGYET